MGKNTLPSSPNDAELESKYGHLGNNQSLSNIAEWGLPNHDVDFKENESLENSECINDVFQESMNNLFKD